MTWKENVKRFYLQFNDRVKIGPFSNYNEMIESMGSIKKPDFNQEEFRKEITEVINKYFTGDTKLSVDEVIQIFGLGFQLKYKRK